MAILGEIRLTLKASCPDDNVEFVSAFIGSNNARVINRFDPSEAQVDVVGVQACKIIRIKYQAFATQLHLSLAKRVHDMANQLVQRNSQDNAE